MLSHLPYTDNGKHSFPCNSYNCQHTALSSLGTHVTQALLVPVSESHRAIEGMFMWHVRAGFTETEMVLSEYHFRGKYHNL